MATDYSDFVRTSRETLGLTQVQLAERLHVATRTVIRWETGESAVKRRDLIAIEKMVKRKRGRVKPLPESGTAEV